MLAGWPLLMEAGVATIPKIAFPPTPREVDLEAVGEWVTVRVAEVARRAEAGRLPAAFFPAAAAGRCRASWP